MQNGISIEPSIVSLLEGIEYQVLCGESVEELQVTSVSADSRKVSGGGLFIAVKGIAVDGHRFIGSAIESGAAAVIADRNNKYLEAVECDDAVILTVDDTAELLGRIAARFYSNPAEQLNMTAVTGTNGKTTVTYLMEHVLNEVGVKTGVIGTVEYRYRDHDGQIIRYPAPFTTPDPILFHEKLKEMADAGVSHVLMEVSSHALQQRRLGPVTFKNAVFTNLSQDHLDYHGSMEEYFEAKSILFKKHLAPGSSVVVFDPGPERMDKKRWADRVRRLCGERGMDVGICGSGDDARVKHISSSFQKNGMSVVFYDGQGTQRLLKSPLVGRFNVENLLVSIAALEQAGIDMDVVCESLSLAAGAPGRLQRVEFPEEIEGRPLVLVDYAHTPDALENVLETVKSLPHRNLFCVFGCGGDRDRTKRPKMGAIGARFSDVAVVTDDNPRSEDPTSIRVEVVSGVLSEGMELKNGNWLLERDASERGCVEIGGRRDAIKAAVCSATGDDIVLIAGKGHERYQVTGGGRIFFDDYLEAQESSLCWNVAMIATATGGRIIKRKSISCGCFSAVSTDTRTIRKNDVFVALKGENFDGHQFVESAVDSGAGCIVVSGSGDYRDLDADVVAVADTLQALGDLARWRRRLLERISEPVVVGITGSCGKTTVKEMTGAIFSRHWPEVQEEPSGRVMKTDGNFNNLIGLPLSLLPATVRHRGIVLEMGMNRPGEILRLTEIADPTIGCITNIHGAHLEGLGSIEGVARAKGELFQQMGSNSIMVVNLDDELVVERSRMHQRPVVSYSVSEPGGSDLPDVWATEIDSDSRGHLSFTLHVRKEQVRVTIGSPGLHNCSNACGAAAIAHAAGIGIETIAAGLRDFGPASNRMEYLETPGGINILNDTYNANPASMASALDTLAKLPCGARAAFLGDMLELGHESPRLHRDLGRKVAESGVDYLGVVGAFSEDIVNGAAEAGLSPDKITVFKDKKRGVDWISQLVHSGRLNRGDWLLVKASRGLALDTAVAQIMLKC